MMTSGGARRPGSCSAGADAAHHASPARRSLDRLPGQHPGVAGPAHACLGLLQPDLAASVDQICIVVGLVGIVWQRDHRPAVDPCWYGHAEQPGFPLPGSGPPGRGSGRSATASICFPGGSRRPSPRPCRQRRLGAAPAREKSARRSLLLRPDPTWRRAPRASRSVARRAPSTPPGITLRSTATTPHRRSSSGTAPSDAGHPHRPSSSLPRTTPAPGLNSTRSTDKFETCAAGGSHGRRRKIFPDQACPVEHWGYIFKGRVRVEYTGGQEEILSAGDAFYIPRGHRPYMLAGDRVAPAHPQV